MIGAGIRDHREGKGHVADIGGDSRGLLQRITGGAADTHRRHRRGDLHPAARRAVVRDLAGDKSEPALDQGEQRAVIRRCVWLERIFVERHARVGDEVESGAVGKADAGRRVGAGLDHVALVDEVADIERHGDPVAHDMHIADDFFHFADRIGGSRRVRLCVLAGSRRTGEEIDDIGSEAGAVRCDQNRVLLAGKISRNDVVAAILAGEHEIGTGALIVAAKQ